MRLLSRMSNGQAFTAWPHTCHRWDTQSPAQCRERVRWKVFSLIRSLPSSLSADSFPSLFERFLGNMPRSDSSGTYMRALRPKPSPAVLLLSSATGISEVSRFSCMKFLGVSGVFDYAGLSRDSR
jgi:hypothetical protein